MFDLTAQAFVERDPATGQPQRSLVHKSRETLQQWAPQVAEASEDGIAFWLPGKPVVAAHCG